MKKSLLALAVLGTLSASAAAQLSYNIGVVSDYRYRGITQTNFNPALQGGIDYAHSSGFYVGAWGSTISWIKDTGNSLRNGGNTMTGFSAGSNIEIDLYGGFKGNITKDLGFDVGVLQYWYPGNKLDAIRSAGGLQLLQKAETTEVYGGLSYGPISAKYSYSLGSLFGQTQCNVTGALPCRNNSRGSTYLEINGNFDLGSGWAATAGVGRQTVKGVSGQTTLVTGPTVGVNANYNLIQLGVSKELMPGLVASATAISTNANGNYYVYNTSATTLGQNLGRRTIVLGLKYAF
jgi:uncharacterized protein (TIGR02001 family)